MSSAADLDIGASTRSAARLSVVPAPREQRDSGDRRPRAGAWGVLSLPLAGQPGHGRTTSLRRQSARAAQDREACQTGAFEIICRDCGDHPSLDYSVIPPWLQRIRGPYSLEAGLAAYAEHLGLVPRQHEAGPG